MYTGTNGASTADKFTASTTTGNGKLTNPVALMTADEVAYAGGKYNNPAEAYYYYNANGTSATGNNSWDTMTPGISKEIFFVDYYEYFGYFGTASVENGNKVRPVLSLKSCVKWKSGDGTSDNPYTVDALDSACSTAEN